MKRIHIYKVDDKLFFVPTLSVGKIFSKMILPIVEGAIKADNNELGRQFIETFKLSTVGETPQGDSGAFKKLIELTKLRTHKKLVRMADCLIATLEEGVYTLNRVGGNEKFNAFMDDIGVKPVELREKSIEEEALGAVIRDLFEKPESTIDDMVE